MALSCELREASPTDRDDLMALWHACGFSEKVRSHAASLVNLTKGSRTRTVVAVASHMGVVGSVLIEYDGWWGWLYRLAVMPQMRRLGIGRELVAFAEEIASSCGAVFLNAIVNRENEPSLRTFSSLGWQVDSQHLRVTKTLSIGASTQWWPDQPAMLTHPSVQVRPITEAIVRALAESFPQRREGLYWDYLQEERQGIRTTIVASRSDEAVGHASVVWESEYPGFAPEKIPEVKDLLVRADCRRQGIGTLLFREAEKLAATRSSRVGIAVGLYADYGAAQRLYARSGYIPDGRGIWAHGHPIASGESIVLDDATTLYMTRDVVQHRHITIQGGG